MTDVHSAWKDIAEIDCDSYYVGLQLQIAYDPKDVGRSQIADAAQRKLKLGHILSGLFMIALAVLIAER